ncbi:peptidase [Streptomyces viridiviolaceus]|uniref:Peptidoglycan DD-metalloendopeptidase family protein n=1 Tax=Streptomyces viridiviolaceus TaxID=68282 RepID=A0ABW2E369_9ACTN|nr:M23 family metallopeptidase [Streptomyces viridiviolaceus]GHB44028.1 peptidase [Streptomyces viridiviolaceus]
MNDRHPSGTMTTPASASDADPAHYASYGTEEAQYGDLTTYGGYAATGFATGHHATAAFHADPLFGNFPGQDTGAYDTSGAYDTTGAYDATQWSTGSHQTLDYDQYAAPQHTAYDTGAYDATAWTAGYQQPVSVPAQATGEASGQWDTGAWAQSDRSGEPADPTQQWEWGTQTFGTGVFDTGAYDATQWNSDGTAESTADSPPPQDTYASPPLDQQTTATFAQLPQDEEQDESAGDDESAATGELPTVTTLLDDQEETTPARIPAPRGASRGAARSRRRQPARRSALLTVAVPSACVMGVAGIAAASVGNLTGGDEGQDTTASAADAQPVKPSTANNKLDTQLASLSAGADDFADRASRTQERIDLKAQQEAEKKKAAEEAARKERLRPKFALPVAQHGLSAYYGQAGINWMSVHSGIDFPVSYGTTVMAATDGTVRTQWNSAYGNMMIVTAKDGTETWYCHLSSYRVPSGTTVKAGDAIAYSGNSGNSTGPHLHFEVRPAGGSAIDPLSWLRSHGLEPS